MVGTTTLGLAPNPPKVSTSMTQSICESDADHITLKCVPMAVSLKICSVNAGDVGHIC